MLKVVVFDSGFGGELFADKLNKELPVVEVIRVIDWRNANILQNNKKEARKIAREDLRPYIGKVDLIVFANHFLTITSLKYFRRKYKNQAFLGLKLKHPDTFLNRDTLVLTTKAVARTINYQNFYLSLKRKTKTLILDSWPALIDDGELSKEAIRDEILISSRKANLEPKEIILACAQFEDIKPELRSILGQNIKIYDSFGDTFRQACKLLGIRGGSGKKQTK